MIKVFDSDKSHPDIILQCKPIIGIPLYIDGSVSLSDAGGVAIVGSRKPTLYGINLAEMIAKASVESGKTVISGLARGIDTEAHRSALKYGGRTIAVLGSGIDEIYPEENIGLAEEIKKNGAVISQFGEGTPPLRQNFPIRNKTVAKLCSVLIVVQASLKSGSLLTARLALEMGKKVFVVPGHIDDKQFLGNNKFLEKHRLNPMVEPFLSVESFKEFLKKNNSTGIVSKFEKIPEKIKTDLFSGLNEKEKLVAEIISVHPSGIDFDTLSIKSELAPSELPEVLLSLSMMDKISEIPGKIFQFTGDKK